MPIYERQEEILQYLSKHNTATVHRLAEVVCTSEATIRRDLTELEKNGKLQRTFGGAVMSEVLNREVPFTLRERANLQAKNIIAGKASRLIKDGDTLFLDASSTVFRLVPYLEKFNDLTVITNGPKTSLALGMRGIKNFCTGGELLTDSIAYVGEYVRDFLSRFNADIMFFSCRGVNDRGYLCDSSVEEVQVRRDMLACSDKSVLLCDSSKFGASYRSNICNISEVSEVITEKDIPIIE